MRTINTAIEKTSSTNPLCPLSMPGATWASVAAEGVCVGLALFFFFFFWLSFPPQAVGVFCHSSSFTINAKKTPTTPSPVNNKQKGVVDMEGEMPREAARMRAPADAICHLDHLRERCQFYSSGGTPRKEREGLRTAEGRKGGRNTALTGQDQTAHSLCWKERECLTV